MEININVIIDILTVAISAFSLFMILITAIIAILQLRQNNKHKRVELFNDIITKLRQDEEMAELHLKLEYGEFKYSKNFHGSEIEKPMDSFLSYLSYIVWLKNQKLISGHEFGILKYYIDGACEDGEIVKYLWNIHHYSKECNKECSFVDLISYATTNNIIDGRSFYDKKNKDYIYYQYLNF